MCEKMPMVEQPPTMVQLGLHHNNNENIFREDILNVPGKISKKNEYYIDYFS